MLLYALVRPASRADGCDAPVELTGLDEAALTFGSPVAGGQGFLS
ncbi:hypothetical protein GA0115233_11102 [Streptomyces sp. DI166]|nr:hypothetical protein GA0115233_11102 [Streptomyces sp. DI166]